MTVEVTKGDEAKLAQALSQFEIVVQDLSEAGVTPLMIASALAVHLNQQVALQAHSPAAALAIKASMIST